MLSRLSVVLVLSAALILPSLNAFAQDDALKFKGGFYERLRHEYWKNNRDMESNYYDGGDRNFFRIKTSVWGQADYDDSLSVFGKLTNEVKGYTFLGSSNRKVYNPDKNHWDPDEIVFDNLYLDVKSAGGLPLDLRLGRQDLLNQYGENFLICDGTPGDGSRTFYFNALKGSWKIDDRNVLDVLYINNPRDDIWLPAINEDKSPVNLNLTAEEAYVLYLKNKSIENLSLEPYYIFKREDSDYGSGLQTEKSRINTLGVFAKYKYDAWTFHAQAAEQYGTYGYNDRNAQGGYLFADRDIKDAPMKAQVNAGFVFLSGDKKGSGENEGWNPLFCRFPIYSELYAQSFQYESGNSYWTNLALYRLGLTLVPMENSKFNINYSFLRANRLTAPNSVCNLSGLGKNRGHLLIAKFDHAFNKNVSSYLLGEYFVPCNGASGFYTKAADPAVFVRTQVEIKF